MSCEFLFPCAIWIYCVHPANEIFQICDVPLFFQTCIVHGCIWIANVVHIAVIFVHNRPTGGKPKDLTKMQACSDCPGQMTW